jgi:hypothetical protein
MNPHCFVVAVLVYFASTTASLHNWVVAQEPAETALAAPADPLPEFDRAKVERQTRFAAAWLLAQQDEDGLWRSSSYGALKAGGATTSLAVYALSHLPESSRRPYRKPIAAGFAGLRPGIKERGYACAPDGTADYPVYATAYTLAASRRMQEWDLLPKEERSQLAEFLLSAQVTEARDFSPKNLNYGGWDLLGVSRPKNLTHGTTMSVTATAIEGLIGFEGEQYDAARAATQQWLNKTQRIPDNGGFVFSPDDADAGNKAGREKGESAEGDDSEQGNDETDTDAENTPLGPAVAYGSTTVDGIAALLAVGQTVDSEQTKAAATWLEKHPAFVTVPGLPFENENDWGIGLRFYYWAGLARAFPLLPEKVAATQRRKLAAHILTLQAEDGSFANTSSRMREDDPLLATSFAIIALGEILAQEE